MLDLRSKLDGLEERYEQITAELGKPEVASDPAVYQKTAKARAELEPVPPVLSSERVALASVSCHLSGSGPRPQAQSVATSISVALMIYRPSTP